MYSGNSLLSFGGSGTTINNKTELVDLFNITLLNTAYLSGCSNSLNSILLYYNILVTVLPDTLLIVSGDTITTLDTA